MITRANLHELRRVLSHTHSLTSSVALLHLINQRVKITLVISDPMCSILHPTSKGIHFAFVHANELAINHFGVKSWSWNLLLILYYSRSEGLHFPSGTEWIRFEKSKAWMLARPVSISLWICHSRYLALDIQVSLPWWVVGALCVAWSWNSIRTRPKTRLMELYISRRATFHVWAASSGLERDN